MVYFVGYFMFGIDLLEDPWIFRSFEYDSFEGNLCAVFIVGSQIDCAARTSADALYYAITAEVEYIFTHIINDNLKYKEQSIYYKMR